MFLLAKCAKVNSIMLRLFASEIFKQSLSDILSNFNFFCVSASIVGAIILPSTCKSKLNAFTYQEDEEDDDE